MANEGKALIAALRDGRGYQEAFAHYCVAKRVLPIYRHEWERLGDPFMCRGLSAGELCAPTMAADAFDEGASDEAIAAQFEEGLRRDAVQFDVVYRAMRKDEAPNLGDLIRMSDRDTQMKLAEIIGLRTVAIAVAGGDVSFEPPRKGLAVE